MCGESGPAFPAPRSSGGAPWPYRSNPLPPRPLPPHLPGARIQAMRAARGVAEQDVAERHAPRVTAGWWAARRAWACRVRDSLRGRRQKNVPPGVRLAPVKRCPALAPRRGAPRSRAARPQRYRRLLRRRAPWVAPSLRRDDPRRARRNPLPHPWPPGRSCGAVPCAMSIPVEARQEPCARTRGRGHRIPGQALPRVARPARARRPRCRLEPTTGQCRWMARLHAPAPDAPAGRLRPARRPGRSLRRRKIPERCRWTVRRHALARPARPAR